MDNFNFQQEFVDAVNNKDIPYLRSFITSEIRIDPSFNKSKCNDCMKYIREKGIDITEAFKQNLNERVVPANRSEWTKELFHDKVEDLRQNFAYNERIEELKEIGRVVYADRIIKETAQSFKEVPRGCRSSVKKPSHLMLLGAIAAVVAVIVTIVLLIRK